MSKAAYDADHPLTSVRAAVTDVHPTADGLRHKPTPLALSPYPSFERAERASGFSFRDCAQAIFRGAERPSDRIQYRIDSTPSLSDFKCHIGVVVFFAHVSGTEQGKKFGRNNNCSVWAVFMHAAYYNPVRGSCCSHRRLLNREPRAPN